MIQLDFQDRIVEAVRRFYWPAVFALITLLALVAALGMRQVTASALRNATPFSLPAVTPPSDSSGQPVVARSAADYAVIAKRNLFNSDPLPAALVGMPDEAAAPVVTSLQVKLVATFVGRSSGKTLAVIQDLANPNAPSVYGVGDKIMGSAEVISIEPGRVEIINNGRNEVLTIAESSEDLARAPNGAPINPRVKDRIEALREARNQMNQGLSQVNSPNPEQAEAPSIPGSVPDDAVTQVDDGNYELDGRFLEEQLQNIGTLMTQARVVPNMISGKIQGYKIFAIKPGSLYEKLGLKNGDIIERVNGVEVKTPDKALTLLQELRYERRFELDYIRQGQKNTSTYNVR